MFFKIRHYEKGQTLVIVALMLTGLVAMLALVLDGGNVYAQRRAAQLAADAGALAGAREYCITENTSFAIYTAQEYAVTRNEATTATASVEPGSGNVTVNAEITFDTFFLGILGRPQLSVSATATAGCSPPSTGLGVMPVAWSCRPPGVLHEGVVSDSEDCAVLYIDHWEDPGDDVCTVGEDPVYMIVDSEDIEEDVYCADPDDEDPPAGSLDCDTNDDGVNDIDLVSGGNRSWLDLNGGGGGASDLSGWVEDGLDEPIYPHTWFAGQTGVAVSVYKTVHEYQLGNEVIIPVFDELCPLGVPNNSDTCIDLFHDHEDPPGATIVDEVVETGGASTDYFHVISFAIFRITCVQAGSYPKGGECPAHKAADLDKHVKTIEGCFIKDFDPKLGGGGGTVDIGAITLYLIK